MSMGLVGYRGANTTIISVPLFRPFMHVKPNDMYTDIRVAAKQIAKKLTSMRARRNKMISGFRLFMTYAFQNNIGQTFSQDVYHGKGKNITNISFKNLSAIMIDLVIIINDLLDDLQKRDDYNFRGIQPRGVRGPVKFSLLGIRSATLVVYYKTAHRLRSMQVGQIQSSRCYMIRIHA